MSDVQLIRPRVTTLADESTLSVRRTLPSRERPFVGAWCFLDHYGPTVGDGPASLMDVPPHPHTGLQTVSWLFSGQIEHRDAAGVHAVIRPGELNLMTSGHGIMHSEVSVPGSGPLHGVQLWIALPGERRDGPRGFQHHVPQEVAVDGGMVRVLIGELAGVGCSPVEVMTPLLGAQLDLAAGAEVSLTLDPEFEHALLLDEGDLTVAGVVVEPSQLAFTEAGSDTLTLSVGERPARAMLLGGAPFHDDTVMWWNFIADDHEGIVAARAQYQERSPRFGTVTGYTGSVQRLEAPAEPRVRLRPRR